MIWTRVALLVALLGAGCEYQDPEDGSGDGAAYQGDGGSTDGGSGEYSPPGVVVSEVQVSSGEDFPFLTFAWTQEGEGEIRFSYSYDDETYETAAATYGSGSHEQLVLGVPYSESVDWKMIYDAGSGDVVCGAGDLVTTALPDGIPTPTLRIYEEDQVEPTGTWLLGSINQDSGGWTGGTYWKWILDRKGRVVWAHKTPQNHWSIFLRISMDGTHILWDEQTYWSDYDASMSTVHRWYLDGTEISETSTPGLHHAFTELPDGTLVWGAVDGYYENLVKRAPGSDEVEQIWSCYDFHRAIGAGSSCQSNTLYHHQPTDSFLYSFYTTSTVVEIDHATGDSLWWAGAVPGGYDFVPSNIQFSWQHGVYWTDEGTLLLSTEDTYYGTASETYVREYEVDHDAQELHQVWTFGEGGGVYASTAGEAHRLPGGNTLHNYGSGSQIKEVTADGDVVWHLDWGSSQLLGRTVFIEDLWTLMPPD